MNNLVTIACAIGLAWFIRKQIMATEAQLNAALDELELALTTEIEEIKEELAKLPNIPDTAINRLSALKERISGIISGNKPPVEEAEAEAEAEGDPASESGEEDAK